MEVESPAWHGGAGVGMQPHGLLWGRSPRSTSAKVYVGTRPRSSCGTWRRHNIGVFPKSPCSQTGTDAFSEYGDSSGTCTPSAELAHSGGCWDSDLAPRSDRPAQASSGHTTPRPLSSSPTPSIMLSFSQRATPKSQRRAASVTSDQLTRRALAEQRRMLQLGDVVREANNLTAAIGENSQAVLNGKRRPYTAPERICGSGLEPSSLRQAECGSSLYVLRSSAGGGGAGGAGAGVLAGGWQRPWDGVDSQPQRVLSASIDWRGAVTPPASSSAVVKRIFKGHSYLKKTRLSIDSKDTLLAGREAASPTQVAVADERVLPYRRGMAATQPTEKTNSGAAAAASSGTAARQHAAPGDTNAATRLFGNTRAEGRGQAKASKAESIDPHDAGHSPKEGRTKKGVSFHQEESIYYYDGKPKLKAAKEYISFVGSMMRVEVHSGKEAAADLLMAGEYTGRYQTVPGQSPSGPSTTLTKQPVIVVCGLADDGSSLTVSTPRNRLDQEPLADKSPAEAPPCASPPVVGGLVDGTASMLHLDEAGPPNVPVSSDEPNVLLELQVAQDGAQTCDRDLDSVDQALGEYELVAGSTDNGDMAEDEAYYYYYYPEQEAPTRYMASGSSPPMLVQPPRTPPSIRPPYTMPEELAGCDLTVEGCSRARSSQAALATSVTYGYARAKNTEPLLPSAPGDVSFHSDGMLRPHGSHTTSQRALPSASASPRQRCARDSTPGYAAAAPSTGRPIPDIVEAEDWRKTASDGERLRMAKAAVDIQRIFRGFVARSVYRKLQREHRERLEDERLAAIEIQRCYRRHLSRKKNIYRGPSRDHARSAAWSRSYAEVLTSEATRRKQAATEALDKNAREKILQRQKIAAIGPHVDVYMIFHPPRDGPTLKQMNHSATTIQKHFRGWSIRRKLASLKVKVALQFPSWVKFAKYYRTYLRKLVRYTGVDKPRVTVDIDQMDKFVMQKKRFESVFDKRSFGNELDEDELEQYFKECDLYPGDHEVEHALDLVLRGKVKKKKKTLTKQEVLDITFQIYMPEGTGLANNRKSTWLHPIVDGEDALKLSGSNLIEPTPLGPCLRLVQESRRERRAAAVLGGGQLALGKSS